ARSSGREATERTNEHDRTVDDDVIREGLVGVEGEPARDVDGGEVDCRLWATRSLADAQRVSRPRADRISATRGECRAGKLALTAAIAAAARVGAGGAEQYNHQESRASLRHPHLLGWCHKACRGVLATFLRRARRSPSSRSVRKIRARFDVLSSIWMD